MRVICHIPNERRYGIAWTPPAPRMRDYVGAVRAVWRAWERQEPLDYHSEHYAQDIRRIPTPFAGYAPGW